MIKFKKSREGSITIGDIHINIVRKNIKKIYLSVNPPDGKVRISIPFKVTDKEVRELIESKLSWIKDKRKKFMGCPLQSTLQYISGEYHYFAGEPYCLNVIETSGRQRVEIRNNEVMDLYVRPNSTTGKRQKVIMEWYRKELKSIIPQYILHWEKIMGVSVEAWNVKSMKTRWGTCNIQAKRIWINLMLAKKHPRCLEYIIVHEMIHLLERNHNQVFYGYMDEFLSHWRNIKDELNKPMI
ncbi:MAG: M48 family metallopeptidase [Eubacteriales bacterium]